MLLLLWLCAPRGRGARLQPHRRHQGNDNTFLPQEVIQYTSDSEVVAINIDPETEDFSNALRDLLTQGHRSPFANLERHAAIARSALLAFAPFMGREQFQSSQREVAELERYSAEVEYHRVGVLRRYYARLQASHVNPETEEFSHALRTILTQAPRSPFANVERYAEITRSALLTFAPLMSR